MKTKIRKILLGISIGCLLCCAGLITHAVYVCRTWPYMATSDGQIDQHLTYLLVRDINEELAGITDCILYCGAIGLLMFLGWEITKPETTV